VSIEIGRIKIVSTGWTGGPGLSQLYFTGATSGTVSNSDAVNAAAAVRTFYNSCSSQFPTWMSFQVQGTVQVLEATTGALIREETITPPTVVNGSAASTVGPTATGILVQWHTAAVFAGRLLRGRTFLVPVKPDAYNTTTGRVSASSITAVQAAGAILAALATSKMVVWHRPVAAGTGGFGTMTGCSVPDTEAILRSRRD